MIWDNYVLRKGLEVEELWDQMFKARREASKPIRLLYIGGKGFDLRAGKVMRSYVERLQASGCVIAQAELVLLSFTSYELDAHLVTLTAANAADMYAVFSNIGRISEVEIGSSAGGEEDISPTAALRQAADTIINMIGHCTDIVLDVSSLPRNGYLTILLRILGSLIPAVDGKPAPLNIGINFQVLAGEDARLDGQIEAGDLANDLVLIPGYSEGLHTEVLEELPFVWFPILGENRIGQMSKVESEIPASAEICPVIPHPSQSLRRGDELLLEYAEGLFSRRNVGLSSILHAHEAHPFEAYRQILGAMQRYQKAFSILGGCRIAVTPLASKLITVGSALACFEMKNSTHADATVSVAIVNSEPRRYSIRQSDVEASNPTLSALVLTGECYEV